MKVEITIDRTKELPKGAVPALEKQLLRRISLDYSDCKLTIRRTGFDGLSVIGCEKSDNKRTEEILQETRESADEWFFK
ncbi:DinI-like family protein [Citrobacter braakii]|nr:DinI-like family protein [Citrobacter braakii]